MGNVRLKIIKSFRLSIISNRLKKISKESALFLLSIAEYLFSDEIQELIAVLDSEFDKPRGPRAYPRTLIIGVLMFCLYKGITSLSIIEEYCEDSRILNKFTCGFNPKEDVFRRFLKDSDTRIVKSIFLYSLIRFEDYGWLDFTRLFVDGTDALVNASKNYLIHFNEIENVKRIKEMGLLHNGKRPQIKQFKEKVTRILSENDDLSKQTIKSLKLALKNSKIYCRNVYKNLDELEQAINENTKDYVSISFHDAVMLKSKKNSYEFGLNLQEIMTNQRILVTGILVRKANDSDVLIDVLNELKLSFEILKELNMKYGKMENDELFDFENLLDHAIFICDAGYFTKENIETACFNDMEVVIMSRQIARQNNNLKREKWLKNLEKAKKNLKKDDVSKKLCIKIVNAFVCPFERLIELTGEPRLLENEYNKRKEIQGELLRYEFTYRCKDCSGCPFVEKYGKKCKCAEIIEEQSEFEFEMTNAFANGEYDTIYKKRMANSECINGFHKKKTSCLYLLCRDFTANINEMVFRNLLFNLIRLRNLKDSVT